MDNLEQTNRLVRSILAVLISALRVFTGKTKTQSGTAANHQAQGES
jgi:hypothetical protein